MPSATSNPAARPLGRLLRVVGLLVFGALVASRLDLGAVRAAWRGLSPFETAGVALVFLLAMAVRVGKWAWQLRSLGFQFSPVALTRSFLLGVLIGAVTPMRTGELYRLAGVDFRPAERTREIALATASLVLEKVYEVLTLVVFVTIGLVQPAWPLAALLAAGTLFGAWIGLGNATPPVWMTRLLPARVAALTLEPMLRAREGLGLGGRFGLFGLTALSHALNLVGALGVYRAFGPMPAFSFFTRMPLVTLTHVLPISIGGIGVREAAAMEIFGSSGFPASSAAVAASVVFASANLLPALALPLLWLFPSQPRQVGAPEA
jgi:hypothetical protein